jgi:DNA-binding Xre family transcriptional regulator
MLKYNLERLFRLRGISKPIPYLMKFGFTRAVSSGLVNNHLKAMPTKHIEKLCLVFQCTPNDLLEWTPNEGVNYENQPIMQLGIKNLPALDLREIGEEIPYDKLASFTEKIAELKKEFLKK